MAITRMEHFLVLTEDIEKTKDFYCDLLDFEVGFRPPLDFPGFWLYIGETPVIHIAEWETYAQATSDIGAPAAQRSGETGPLDHVAFNAQDFDGVLSRLEAGGLDVWQNIVPGGTMRQLFFRDPSGLKIELNFMS